MAFYKCVGEQPTGNADPSDVLAGRTFSTETGAGKVGTMPNRGNWSATLSATSPSVTIPTGYHNGSGTVSVRLQEKTAVLYNAPSQVDADPGYALSRVYVPAASGRLQQKTVNPNTAGLDVTPDDNYLGLSKVHVNPQVHDLTMAFPTGLANNLYDMGANHRVRYVNGANLYNLGHNRGIFGASVRLHKRYRDTQGELDNPIELTADWEGAMLIVSLKYDSTAHYPTIYPLNNLATQAEPHSTVPSAPLGIAIDPIQNYIHVSSGDQEYAQNWIQSVYNVKNGAIFQIMGYGWDQVVIFKITSEYN